MASEWSLPAAIDAVTDGGARPRDARVDVGAAHLRRGAGADRAARRVLRATADSVCGANASELARWECGQSPVAILLSNCPEYVETMLGAYRARAVPFNVNHHYNPAEVAQLLDQIGAEAVVYHRRLAPLLADARVTTDRLLVHVDDGSGRRAAAGQHPVRSGDRGRRPIATRCRHRRPTTSTSCAPAGRPAARRVCCGGRATCTSPRWAVPRARPPRRIAATAAQPAQVWFAAPPLMHGAAQWTVFAALHNGRTVVLHDDAAPFDARTILETAEREHVSLLTIVGRRVRAADHRRAADAALRPLVAAAARDRRRADRAGAQARAARTAART